MNGIKQILLIKSQIDATTRMDFNGFSVHLRVVSRAIMVLIMISASIRLAAQEPENPDSIACQQLEIGEVLFKKQVKPVDTSRTLNAFLLPYIAYNPSKGFQLGAGGTISWYQGTDRETNQSAAQAAAEFTSMSQKIFQLKSNVYTNRNRWFLQGDWRYYIYTIKTFGLGTGRGCPVPPVPGLSPDSVSVADWEDSFQVDFKWFRVHEIFSYKLAKNFYAGMGYHLDIHYEIEDLDLNLDSAIKTITPHYAYCVEHGFDTDKYVASGMSLNLVYDTRDNMINPFTGIYIHLNLRFDPSWMGSTKSNLRLWSEFRTYLPLQRKFPRHLIAFWYFGGFQFTGNAPYFDLWATGFDQMNASGRGSLQGRWRGDNVVYGEVEYRFPISRCSQVLGGVLFINATTASSVDLGVPLFGYIRPAGGIGLRIMVSKANRTNIAIDFSIGETLKGLYFSAQEKF
jgi:outer membrane protein assembly factor BamA